MNSVGPGLPPPRASISFVCEAGRLEAQAVLLAASLRTHHPDIELIAAVPGALPERTVHALAALRVATVAIANPLAADYPIGHKLAALAAGWQRGLRVFLDSDMLCLAPLDWAQLASHAFAAKPADIATFGNASLWQCLYRRFGLPAPDLRVVATTSGELTYPYFNAGMLATTAAGPLSAVWIDACRAIDGMRDIEPRRPWLDQIGLPLALGRLGLSMRALDESWNYPVHIQPLRDGVTMVHYHEPKFVAREPVLLERLAGLLERDDAAAHVVAADPAWADVLRALVPRSAHADRTQSGDGAHANAARENAPGVRAPQAPRDMLITGIPRSGTSYFCKLLDGFDNTAVVNEPQAVFKGLLAAPEPRAVPELHARLRAAIEAGEAVDNKLDAAGALAEDTARDAMTRPWRAHVRNTEFVLASKNTLAYMARLEGILEVMPGVRVVALVRHPLDTLASWKGSFEHLASGDPRGLPVGGPGDPFLPASLRTGLEQLSALRSSAVRRAAWWHLLAEELRRLEARIEIVRYEDLVAHPDDTLQRALGPLAECAGRPSRPFAPSAAHTAGPDALDDADRQAAALLCAGVAEAFGYNFGDRVARLPPRRQPSTTGGGGVTEESHPPQSETGSAPAARLMESARRADEGSSADHRHGLVGRPDLWRMKRAFQIDFLRRQGLRTGQSVLDVGCGSLRGGAALIAYLDPGGYCGIDVRANVLDQARRELQREKLMVKRPELRLVPDMRTLDLGRRFDVVWAFSVLFHLADPILDDCFAMAVRHLATGGVFFANVIVGDGASGAWQGFPVTPRALEAYRSVALRHGLGMRVMGTLADLGHHSGDPSQDGQSMLAFGAGAEIVLR